MAARIPLVIVNGEIEQLQAGDYILVPISGAIEVALTNDNAGALVKGTAVYMTAADHCDKAKASSSVLAMMVGIVNETSITAGASGVVATEGIVTATTAQWDAVAGTTGGLTFATRYYLDPATAGLLTSTAPTTVGQYVVEVGIALSTTELKLAIQKRILL